MRELPIIALIAKHSKFKIRGFDLVEIQPMKAIRFEIGAARLFIIIGIVTFVIKHLNFSPSTEINFS